MLKVATTKAGRWNGLALILARTLPYHSQKQSFEGDRRHFKTHENHPGGPCRKTNPTRWQKLLMFLMSWCNVDLQDVWMGWLWNWPEINSIIINKYLLTGTEETKMLRRALCRKINLTKWQKLLLFLWLPCFMVSNIATRHNYHYVQM